MEILQAIALGALQGVTEFLPVSSSGHLVLLPYVAGWDSLGLAFDVILHLGTFAAIVVVFFTKIAQLLRGFFMPTRYRADARLAWIIIAASIPAAVIGFALVDIVEGFLRDPLVVVFGLLFGSTCLWFADHLIAEKKRTVKKIEQVGFWQGIGIGMAQTLALVPGVSRSGVTMSTAAWLGFDRPTSAAFSFLLGAPVFLGAGVHQIMALVNKPNGVATLLSTPMIVGFVSALFVGMIAIRFLLKYLHAHSFRGFVWYRTVLALIIFVVLFT